jgi:FO synthase
VALPRHVGLPLPLLPPPALARDEDRLLSELAEIRAGAPIASRTAHELIACSDRVLPALLQAALVCKQGFKPGLITYSRKVFIPLTNLCRDYCGYCTFRRDPGEPGAHTMLPEEVLEVVRQGERLGCTEALFSLGDKPESAFPEMRSTLQRLGYKSTLHYLEAMCELVVRETKLLPHANPGLMSAEWVERLARWSPSLGLMLETTSDRLLQPGAAHDRAPDKIPARRLRTVEDAGRLGVPFTTGLLIGIGETLEDRVHTLFAIRSLHERYGHIQEVIVQNFRVKPGIPMSNWVEPGRGDMLRTTAVARLVLRDMNIQAPPNLFSPNYEQLLSAGINDWGGVSPLTPDFINPEAPWPHLADLEARTRAAGYELRQRLPVYPEFMARVSSPHLRERIASLTGAEGYVEKAA